MAAQTELKEKPERLNSIGKSIRFTRGQIRNCRLRGDHDIAEALEDDLFELKHQFGECFDASDVGQC